MTRGAMMRTATTAGEDDAVRSDGVDEGREGSLGKRDNTDLAANKEGYQGVRGEE